MEEYMLHWTRDTPPQKTREDSPAMGHALTKARKLSEARRLYLLSPRGLSDIELAHKLAVDRSLAYDYRKELACVAVSPGRYTLEPTIDDINLALAVLQRAGSQESLHCL